MTLPARALLLLLPVSALGCGGASPLLHPAQTLEQNQVAFGSGVASRVAVGNARTKIDQGRAIAGNGSVANDEEEQAFVEGSLLEHVLAPGLTPWVAGRVGLGHRFEAGLAYTGRRLRVDGRHAFELGDTALSVGGGINALLLQVKGDGEFTENSVPSQRVDPRGFNFEATGFGVDLPVIWGWRSSSWFEPWLGLRFGYEQVTGEVQLLDQNSEPGGVFADAAGRRLQGEWLVGLSAGTEPFFLRLELAAGAQRCWGALDFPEDYGAPAHRTLKTTTFTVQPAAAIVLEL